MENAGDLDPQSKPKQDPSHFLQHLNIDYPSLSQKLYVSLLHQSGRKVRVNHPKGWHFLPMISFNRTIIIILIQHAYRLVS